MIHKNAVEKAESVSKEIPAGYSISSFAAGELLDHYSDDRWDLWYAFFALGFSQGRAATVAEWSKEPKELKTKDDCKRFLFWLSGLTRNVTGLQAACEAFSLLARGYDNRLHRDMDQMDYDKSRVINKILNVDDKERLDSIARWILALER